MLNLLLAIWESFRSLPGWVQVWMALLLVPINLISLLFLSEPGGQYVAILACLPLVFNLGVVLVERGFSKLLSIPHIPPWGALLVYIAVLQPGTHDNFDIYLWVLGITNAISLAFDLVDASRWFKGERAAYR